MIPGKVGGLVLCVSSSKGRGLDNSPQYGYRELVRQMWQSITMRFTLSRLRFLAHAMLGLVLFTQCVVVAQACDTLRGTAMQALAGSDNSKQAMPCHKANASSTHACLAHCSRSDLVRADQHSVPLVVPTGAVSWTASRPQAQYMHPSVVPATVALNTGPPLSIRYCSFLL